MYWGSSSWLLSMQLHFNGSSGVPGRISSNLILNSPSSTEYVKGDACSQVSLMKPRALCLLSRPFVGVVAILCSLRWRIIIVIHVKTIEKLMPNTFPSNGAYWFRGNPA
jgi:hypothetical protein